MKALLLVLNVIFCLGLSTQALAMNVTRAPNSETKTLTKEATCRYISGDIGTIIGRGSSKNAAFADAAEKCFDRRVQMYEQVRQATVDMDRGQDFIDSCANITCS